MHKLSFEKGTDARNAKVRCDCGWAHCSTMKSCKIHGEWHVEDAGNHPHKWNDRGRPYMSRQQAMIEKIAK